ncbi:PREDICTED: coiled-coil domain-containing protein 8 [Elephantulus edwardii]|uniref:coiled-coil domain-containing protein 8 n=1 Tax=Elephantulus edwardii TaxID=28737 RepID=UPI0003F0A3A3|nr:PREDICTED: coiled-coil domain-containing protein 8 [Elephantulus edwardii]
MLQIGEDVDYLLIPREVRLAGGVWRVISKPATKEAEFRERLTQFLEEEGRTLEDVARIIEKSTPHPPQPRKKPQAPQVRRRVQQMVPPPPRLVVGTYDSSNASDSELSDFETSRDRGERGPGPARRVRRMPVSYLGSKFLGSDVESEDDEDLVEAFLRRRERQPSAAPARRRGALPVEDRPPPPSKADRWRECAGQVSWAQLKRRVRSWAPRSFPGAGEARSTESRAESDRPAGQDRDVDNTGEGQEAGGPARRWKPKISWGSMRLRRREEAPSIAPDAEVPSYQGAADTGDQEAGIRGGQGVRVPDDQGADIPGAQGAEVPGTQVTGVTGNQGAGVPGDLGAGDPAAQVAEVPGDQGSGVPGDQRAEVPRDLGARDPAAQVAEVPGDQGTGVPGDQGAEGSAAQGAEAPALQVAPGAAPEAKARKQVKTVRFQTPGRFAWFRKRRRAFWRSPRLPTLPKRVPRAGEARNLRVLRAEASVEEGEQEGQL